MADRRLFRKMSRYAPYVAPTPRRRRYESSDDHEESDFSEYESIREHSETARRLEEASINDACLPKTSENSREDASVPVSSSTYLTHNSSTAESSKQGDNAAIPQREDPSFTSEYVGDEAYFSDNDFSDFLDNLESSDEEESNDRTMINSNV